MLLRNLEIEIFFTLLPAPAQKQEYYAAILKQKNTVKLFVVVKIAYFCCFSIGEIFISSCC